MTPLNNFDSSAYYTVGIFQDFPVTQILREIKVGEARVSKSAILTHLESLQFDFFYEFLHILKAQIYQIGNI